MGAQNPGTALNPILAVQQFEDVYLRQNFLALNQYFSAQNQLYGFKFFEQVFTQAQTAVKLPHGLGYAPRDILVSSITGAGSVTFNYAQFDAINMSFDVSGPCWIRFYAGSYRNWNNAQSPGPSDTQTFSSATASKVKNYTAVPLTAAQISSGSYTVVGNVLTVNSTMDYVGVNAASGGQIVQLPQAATMTGRELTVIKTDSSSNTVLIKPYQLGSTQELIGAATLLTLSNQFDRAMIYSNGTTWFLINTNAGGSKAPTFTKLIGGLSTGKYSPPAGCKYLRIKMVGGGGAGGNGGAGSAGSATTFGSFLSAGGGAAGGTPAAGAGGTTYTLNAPAVGFVFPGGGGGTGQNGANQAIAGTGGNSFFGGGSSGSASCSYPGSAAAANTGAGSGGGACLNGTMSGGGGAGLTLDVVISDFSTAPWTYVVGQGGQSGFAVGADGAIYIEENY